MQFAAGQYFGTPIEWKTTLEGTNKTKALQIKFNVTHIWIGTEWAEVQATAERTVYVWLSDKAFDISAEKLDKLGFNGDFGNPEFSEKVKKEGCQIECEHEQYNGKLQEKWNLPGGAREKVAATNDDVRRLNALWKKKNDRSAPPTTAPPVTPEPVAADAGPPVATPQLTEAVTAQSVPDVPF